MLNEVVLDSESRLDLVVFHEHYTTSCLTQGAYCDVEHIWCSLYSILLGDGTELKPFMTLLLGTMTW